MFIVFNNRVAITPSAVSVLVKKGLKVQVEENAGLEAQFRNEEYEKAGAVVTGKDGVFKSGKKKEDLKCESNMKLYF